MTDFSSDARSRAQDLRQSLAGQPGFSESLEHWQATVHHKIDDLLALISEASPYLSGLVRRQPEFTARLIEQGPDATARAVLHDLGQEAAHVNDDAALMRAMRQAKSKIALTAALADLTGTWSLGRVTGTLSDLAILCLHLGVRLLLWQRMQRGELGWPDQPVDTPSDLLMKDSGYVILAMGKLGGRELNYSSDIDLIALFDEQKVDYRGRTSPTDCFVRLTQDLITMMERRTQDGYVFRTDLRLRPDPGATPLALSMLAAETYYQSQALNWERSAMIKALPAAGDLDAGHEYLKRLTPFVWRRSLDFAALQDIQAIKDQIHRHHGHGAPQLAGYDVKLGPGGIREIEFFAQVNQLLFGGRDPSLRNRATLTTLDDLVMADRLATSTRDDLAAAYHFLREVEHRIQMMQDAQDHQIPKDGDGARKLALLCGYGSPADLEAQLLSHVRTVQHHYDQLMPRTDDSGRLTGDALAARLDDGGFERESAEAIIERWRRGRYRALRTQRAQRIFEQCLPRLLDAFGETDAPDQALGRFDAFLERLPAGVQLFALFQANPQLFGLIARIMGAAPALANHLAKNENALDAVIDPDFYADLPSAPELKLDLQKELRLIDNYEEILDQTRLWLTDQKFRIGVHVLEGLSDVDGAASAFTDLADSVLQVLMPHVAGDYARRYGSFPGGDLAVLAMGKFGGREMSFASDLDLVLLYDTDGSTEQSTGPREVPAGRYFSGLGQAFITAITALTPAGRLYEVDTRLRPSGNQGPLVVTLETFEEYYRDAAWTWEHMALTRARMVIGSESLSKRIQGAIRRTLTQPREGQELVAAVASMRQRLADQFATTNPWSVKHVRGGLVDIEFICQYLTLRDGSERPALFAGRLIDVINEMAAAEILTPETAQALRRSWRLQLAIQAILRICLTQDDPTEKFSPKLREVLVKAARAQDFESLETQLVDAQETVRRLYRRIIQAPADGLEQAEKRG